MQRCKLIAVRRAGLASSENRNAQVWTTFRSVTYGRHWEIGGTAMLCRECGFSIEESSKFCRHCGATQSGAALRKAVALADTRGETPRVENSSARKAIPLWGKLGLGFLSLLVAIAIFSPSSPDSTKLTGDVSADLNAAAADAMADINVAANDAAKSADAVAGTPSTDSAPSGNWEYTSNEDKVRGGTSYYASTTSTNSISQGFPYGDSNLRMTVRKSPAYGTDVILTLESGQLMCPSYEGCYGTVRFDNGSPKRVNFNGAADGSSDTIFVEGAKSLITRMKKAKKAVIEIEVYQAGRPQFEFNVDGLRWNH